MQSIRDDLQKEHEQWEALGLQQEAPGTQSDRARASKPVRFRKGGSERGEATAEQRESREREGAGRERDAHTHTPVKPPSTFILKRSPTRPLFYT